MTAEARAGAWPRPARRRPEEAAGAGTGGARRHLRLRLVVAVVALLAAVGAVLAAAMVGGTGGEAGRFGLAQDVPVSFGVVAVEHVERLGGLTSRDLAGVTHGIPNLVPAGKVQLQASVTLTNLSDRPVAYSPAQFRLRRRGTGPAVPPSSATVQPGTLQPKASVDARLSFVVPADGSRLDLEFRDPGRARPLVFRVGTTGRAAAPERHGHGG